MHQAALADSKPYHHGDLRRALLDAAMVILEREGAASLTLRAVAREAGVSPAAPYHHFKDKSELLYAISKEGFRRLKVTMERALKGPGTHVLGVAYAHFAKANPALYRVMYDCARNTESLPQEGEHDDGALRMLKHAMTKACDGKISETDLELSVIAAWCAAHGLAELQGFPQFQPLKDKLGGERAFLEGVLEHLGSFGRATHL